MEDYSENIIFEEQIPGPKGDQGEKGDKGNDGEQGPQGEKGEQGDRGLRGFPGEDGKDGKDGDKIQPLEIVNKLNTLKDVLNVDVIKGAISRKDLDNQEKKVLEGMKTIDGRIKLIDQRWHGGGLNKVTTDSTLKGNGTPSSPLSVISSGGANPVGGLNAIQVYGTSTSLNGDNTKGSFNPSTGNLKALLLTGQYTNLLGSAYINPDGSAVFGTNASFNNVGNLSVPGFKLTISPTSGYVLTSDSSGNGTWQASSGGFWSPNGTDIYNNNTGNVGIGTTTPPYKLSIANLGNNAGDGLLFSYDATPSYRNSISNQWDSGVLANNKMFFYVSDMTTTGQNAIMALLGNGNVGIGTSNPIARLQLDATSGETNLYLHDATNGDGFNFYFTSPIGSPGDLNIESKNGGSRLILDSYNLLFKNSGVQKMILDNNGNLGINTTSPAYKLDVVADTFSADTPSSFTASLTAESLQSGGVASTSGAIYGPLDTTSGSSSENFGSGSIYTSQGQSWNYIIYPYRIVNGVKLTSPNGYTIPFTESFNDGVTPFTVSVTWSSATNGDGSSVDGYIVSGGGLGNNNDVGNTTGWLDDGTSAGGATVTAFTGLTASNQSINYAIYLQGTSPSGTHYYGNPGTGFNYTDPYGNGSFFQVPITISSTGGLVWTLNEDISSSGMLGTGDQSFVQTSNFGGAAAFTSHYGWLADGSGNPLTSDFNSYGYDPVHGVYSSTFLDWTTTDPGDSNYYYIVFSSTFTSPSTKVIQAINGGGFSEGFIVGTSSYAYDVYSTNVGTLVTPTANTTPAGRFTNESTDGTINTLILDSEISGGTPRLSFQSDSSEVLGIGKTSGSFITSKFASGYAQYFQSADSGSTVLTEWIDSTGAIKAGINTNGHGTFGKSSLGGGVVNVGAGSSSLSQIVMDSTTTLPSSPVAGGVEFDGTEYYGTDGSSRRTFVRQTSSSTMTSLKYPFVDSSGHITTSNSPLGINSSTPTVLNVSIQALFQAGAALSSNQILTIGSGGLITQFAKTYLAVTANTTFSPGLDTIDVTANTVTLTLPTAVGATGRIFTAKNSGSGVVTIACTSSQKIDGLTTQTLAALGSMTFQSTGASSTGNSWIIISKV